MIGLTSVLIRRSNAATPVPFSERMQQQGLANGNDKQQNLRTTVTADLIKCTKPSSQPASKSHPGIPAQHRQKSHHAALPPRPPSKRQACRGTFKRILQQRLQEDEAFAEFEAAVKSGPGTASAPTPPPAPPVTEGGVVKKKRGRPPKPRPLYPVPTRPLFYGKCWVSKTSKNVIAYMTACVTTFLDPAQSRQLRSACRQCD